MEGSEDDHWKEKEQYYRKLNNSLKRKAASLISRAESALKEQSEACSSLEISAEHDVIHSQSKQLGKAGPGSAPVHVTQDHYQVSLNPKVATPVPRDGSDSDESLVEAFDKLDTQQDDNVSTSSLVSRELSGAAQARLYQAKLRVARAENKRLKEQVEKLIQENGSLTDKSKTSDREQQRATASSQKQTNEIARLRRTVDETAQSAEQARAQMAAWKKEAETESRSRQSLQSAHAQLEVKLRRSAEEAEKVRSALETERERAREAAEEARDKQRQLEAANKKLEKQKQELIVGFKKQMKLIDVLKRQKIHLEGAKLLQISEEEFLKVVDLNLHE